MGHDGAVARFAPERGWEREFLLSSAGFVARPTLRGVAWPEAQRAHAVGDLGAMWLWRGETGLWERDPAAPVGFEGNLQAIAFRPGDPFRGYAAGTEGVLLRYDKTWTQEPLPAGFERASFWSLAFAGDDAIAVAEQGVLVNDGGGWRVDAGVQALLDSLPRTEPPQLLAAAGLPDGGAVVAGRELVLVRDSASSGWRFSDQPLVGLTAVAAAATRDAERVRPVVSAIARLRYPIADQLPEADRAPARPRPGRRSRCRRPGPPRWPGTRSARSAAPTSPRRRSVRPVARRSDRARATARRAPRGPRALLYTGGRLRRAPARRRRARMERYATLLSGGELPVFAAVSAGDVAGGSAAFPRVRAAPGAAGRRRCCCRASHRSAAGPRRRARTTRSTRTVRPASSG